MQGIEENKENSEAPGPSTLDPAQVPIANEKEAMEVGENQEFVVATDADIFDQIMSRDSFTGQVKKKKLVVWILM